MEVIAGYKQTEVGVIPEDWDALSFSEFVTEFRGGAPLKPSDFKTSGIKVLPKGAVGRTGWLKIDSNELQYCSPSYAEKHRNNQVNDSYTIVVLRDLVPSGPSIGLIVQVKEPDTWVLAQGVYGFKVNDRVLPAFLTQLSNTHWYRQLMISTMVGSTQVHITNTAFKATLIPLPSHSEQRAIATALSDVDALLDGLTRLIAKKRDLKQATMQQLLTGQTRLPGFSGRWELKMLGDLGSTYGGLTGKTKSDFGVGAARYITFMNVMMNVLIDCEAFDQVQVSSNESQNRVIQGDLLFNGSSETPEEVAFCSYMAKDVPDLFLNSFCFGFRLRDKQQADGLFLSYYIRATPGRELMKSLAQGSTRYNLSKGALLQASVLLPPKDEQTAIATVLSDMDAELASLEARLTKTRALKQAMMSELLTGKTRLLTS